MADRPSARDEDRLPWLEPFGEGEKRKARKPVSRTVTPSPERRNRMIRPPQ